MTTANGSINYTVDRAECRICIWWDQGHILAKDHNFTGLFFIQRYKSVKMGDFTNHYTLSQRKSIFRDIL